MNFHQGLPPVISCTTVLLILGSFPGAASLAQHAYYAHARNQFWPILQAVFSDIRRPVCGTNYQNSSDPATLPPAARYDWLLRQGLGLWDVYATCARQGSLDSAIRQARLNDFAGLRARCPRLKAVAFNGAQAWRHAAQVLERLNRPGLAPVTAYKLPSTSPAHASWSRDRKEAAWREVVQAVLAAGVAD